MRRSGLKLLLSFVLLSPTLAHAQLDFGSLLNPGPLADAHASLEGITNCKKCHATAKGVPDGKCLECHTEIQDGLAQGKGYHARIEGTCVSCHGDHKGRQYDMTGLTRLAFDHDDTGWPLESGHLNVDCRKCHKTNRKNVDTGGPTARPTYLGAPTACVACHEDIHGARKEEFRLCGDCHTARTWKPMKRPAAFNHASQAAYPLTGAHKKVACYACHKNKSWAPLPFANCTDCHADPHKGKLGPNCEQCHSTKTWKGAAPIKGKAKFDHNKTPFPLKGEHQQVTCLRCHGPVIGKMKNFQQCSGCHNNPHGAQFEALWTVKKCSNCHIEDGWSVLSFRHGTDSRFPLDGEHRRVPCKQCHADTLYRWLTAQADCQGCHLDVHKRQFKRTCADCHTPKGFALVSFDHNKQSRFPLVGKHQSISCEKCHEGGKFSPIETNCDTCHTDFHNGELGKECRRCHAPIAYNDITFDHNRESRFRLEGVHKKTACNQCHTNYKYKLEAMECDSCHRDVHEGMFGTQCKQCHSFEGFAIRKEGFHDFGEFSLGGVHDKLECVTCHNPRETVRVQPTQCTSCHLDPHLNSFGAACIDCHNQTAWIPSTFRHSQTGFDLQGAHRFVQCESCHFNRVFGGLPTECDFCHRKDFKTSIAEHNTPAAQIAPCDQCHFTFGWRPAR